MRLGELLGRNANNLDIFRMVAACMVIYGHAYSITPQFGYSDWVERLLGYDYSGSLAVKIFFFISGLVVTNSLLSRRDAIAFVCSRFFRIWPAFMLVVIVSALVIGPIYSSFSPVEYFSSSQFKVTDYILSNFLMDIRYYLPGVFFELPYEAAVNGSLWTLYYEVGAYLGLLLMFLLGIFRDKFLATLVLVFLLISQHFISADAMHPIFHQPILVQCFAFGALLALYKDSFELHSGVVFFGWIVFYACAASAFSKYFLYIAIFLTILYLSGTKLLLAIKPKIDVSYGIYLWGFPVQQMLAYHFLELGVRFNQVAAIVVCIVLGYLSWYLVEERSIAFGGRVAKNIKGRVDWLVSRLSLKGKTRPT
ncbi:MULTISPECIES: acyltransferase family protein [Pseudomonas]|nr:acyltransferase [Pseudomonas putida]